MDEKDYHEKILDQLITLNNNQSELVSIFTILVQPEIEKRLSHIFSNPDEFTVYMLTDGKNSSVKISEIVNVSSTTISRWWQKWDEDFHIVETAGYRNPYKAKYSLIELTILFGKPQTINKSNSINTGQ